MSSSRPTIVALPAPNGVEPFDDSTIPRWPNFRPRTERELENLYPSAFVGVGGQHTLGKWLGVARRDRKPVQIVPFRLGAHFDADGLEVHLHNDWLTGLDEESWDKPLRYLEAHLPNHEALFRSWRIRIEPSRTEFRPSRSLSGTIAALRRPRTYFLRFGYHHRRHHGLSQADGLRTAFVRMYPLYDAFIQPAVADRQRFVGRKKPAASFVEELGGLSKPGADVIHLNHTGGLPQPAGASSANPRLCPADGNHT